MEKYDITKYKFQILIAFMAVAFVLLIIHAFSYITPETELEPLVRNSINVPADEDETAAAEEQNNTEADEESSEEEEEDEEEEEEETPEVSITPIIESTKTEIIPDSELE